MRRLVTSFLFPFGLVSLALACASFSDPAEVNGIQVTDKKDCYRIAKEYSYYDKESEAEMKAACNERYGAGRDETYLRYVTVETSAGSERILLHWPKRKLGSLTVYLPRPPEGLFEAEDDVFDAVVSGVKAWEGVLGDGLPRIEFVDEMRGTDIPIVWAREPDGDWYIAHCAYDVDLFSRRFGVSRILITGRWQGQTASLAQIYMTTAHEMGHAMGLMGHSPDPNDLMYAYVGPTREDALSERDRKTLIALYAKPNGARAGGSGRGR